MNAGKARYDSIPVPAELESAIDAGISRAEKRAPTRRLKHALAGVAAAVCIMFAGANIMPVYSYAADIPVLGSIVRVLHIGSGGEVTDGAQVGADTAGDRVELTFGDMASAPYYTVEHLSAPNRIVLRLHGVRGADFDAIRENLMGAEAVQDVYRNMILDDSMLGLTIVLKGGYGFEVTEYADPGTLAFTFAQDAESGEGTVYYLRTDAMDYSEQLGLLCEQYHNEGASQLKTLGGKYIVTIGQFESEAEAEAALAALGDEQFYVAGGSADEIPED